MKINISEQLTKTGVMMFVVVYVITIWGPNEPAACLPNKKFMCRKSYDFSFFFVQKGFWKNFHSQETL